MAFSINSDSFSVRPAGGTAGWFLVERPDTAEQKRLTTSTTGGRVKICGTITLSPRLLSSELGNSLFPHFWRRTMKRSKLMLALAGGAIFALTGCAMEAGTDSSEFDSDDLAQKDQEFIAWDNAQTYLIARAQSSVTVCLQGSGMTTANRPTREGWFRTAIDAWVDGARGASSVALITNANVTFSCSNQHVTVNWSSSSGRANAGKGFVNLFSGDGYTTVLHELGHVFGIGDTYVEGVWTCHPGQQNSVMCGSGGLFSTLQPDDINAISEVYCMAFPAQCTRRWDRNANWCSHSNGQLFLGDFNNDGRDDMLCHDKSNGDKWIDYSSGSGQFGGTNWSAALNWCSHNNGRLHIGDFNNDGRDDMLCHDVSNGDKWIDYANSSGQFGGTNWSAALNWCIGSNAQLFVGDFNNDGRDDMLCHDKSNGNKWIDYANSSGQFGGTDWSAALNWCIGSNAQLFVGDFNSDGRDDMLCHDKANGNKWIDRANSSGQFGGTDWSAALGWCTGPNAQLFVGDFNSDGRDDMLCHDKANGNKWIAFANSSGNFEGTSRQWNPGWCGHAAGQLLVGDFDANGASDFLCHDTGNGYKWVARQFP